MSDRSDGRCRRPRGAPGGWAAERALVHNLRVTAGLVLEALRAAAAQDGPERPGGALPPDLAAAYQDLTDFLAPGRPGDAPDGAAPRDPRRR